MPPEVIDAHVLRVAFAGTFSARLEAGVRARLGIPCAVVTDDERGIVPRLGDVDVLVTMVFTKEMGGAARRLKLVQALHRALAEERIAGAALDVWYRYPTAAGATLPARQPVHELPNVLVTPHVSGWTEGMLAARAEVIAEDIHRVARGEPPVNLIPLSP